jgi:histone H3/H4
LAKKERRRKKGIMNEAQSLYENARRKTIRGQDVFHLLFPTSTKSSTPSFGQY